MKEIIKAFFYSKGKFRPIFFWITALMVCIITAFISILLGYTHVKQPVLVSLIGMVVALLSVYNIYEIKKM
jgi:uncharacterized membrane protein YhaH (DUF805 family)